jgi:hypothetical protein
MLIYCYIHFDKMVNYREDKVSVTYKNVPYEEMGTIHFKDMEFLTMVSFFNSTTWIPFEYDDNAKRHVTIQFN